MRAVLPAMLVLLLAGCVQAGTLDGICILAPAGQRQGGVIAVRYHCEPAQVDQK